MPRRLLMLVTAVLAAVVVGVCPPAAQPAAAAGPIPGAVFNDPTGQPYQQVAIIRRLMMMIDGAPSGSVIRIATYTFSMDEVADKLLAAHARGVKVRLILDDHETKPVWQRMAAVLGTDPTQESFAVTCHMSCMSDNAPSYMHAKIYMFSTSGKYSDVVMVSSTNPTYSQARHGWNDAYTFVGNRTMYNGFKKYFEDMTTGSTQPVQGTESPDYYFTTTSGAYKAYFFPIGGTGRDNDPMWQILDNIKCTRRPATGYGFNGRTTVRVAMFQWSDRRVRLAEKLWKLDNDGCDVEILYNPFEIHPVVWAALKVTGGLNGGPRLQSAYADEDKDGIADDYVHHKFVLVNGVYGSDTSARVVFAGSPNWTNNALHYNNEVLLKISTNSAYWAYYNHYVKVRAWAREHSTASGSKVIVPAGFRGWGVLERLGPAAD